MTSSWPDLSEPVRHRGKEWNKWGQCRVFLCPVELKLPLQRTQDSVFPLLPRRVCFSSVAKYFLDAQQTWESQRGNTWESKAPGSHDLCYVDRGSRPHPQPVAGSALPPEAARGEGCFDPLGQGNWFSIPGATHSCVPTYHLYGGVMWLHDIYCITPGGSAQQTPSPIPPHTRGLGKAHPYRPPHLLEGITILCMKFRAYSIRGTQ